MTDTIDDAASRDRSGSFAEERHQQILALLAGRGRVRNSDLAAMLDVAEPTIRRDIADLARQRRLTRTHGGAIAMRPQLEPDLPMRIGRNAPGKSAIARACLGMISDGDAVYLDAGSTILRIAEYLADDSPDSRRPRNVNVLTNAMPVAQTLAQRGDTRHTVIGGSYRTVGACFVGPLAIQSLSSFTVNAAFIGVTGWSESGFSVSDLTEAQVKAAAIQIARRVVVPMDVSKVGASDFARVCGLEDVTTVVIDAPNTYLLDIAADMGVEVVIAGEGTE
ncbi:MAG: DeoR/GlpR family DNA-binding transcription regulator [Actinomycetota bacterium]|nr:DeoR/GlpR family DNA-binding transcription regulator [Actinomycetota bacterium]